MDTYHKNRLQDYCQKEKFSLPSYRIKKQSGPDHALKFQVEVEVNGRWYVGRNQCSSKREAEQSAADNAWQSLVTRKSRSNSARLPPTPVLPKQLPLHALRVKRELIEHLSSEYAGVERFIVNIVGRSNGQIGNIWTPDVRGRYKIEITGSYRYCENIKKHHKKSQIYFLVDPVKKIYYQKCYHRTCLGFRSARRKLIDEQELDVQKENNIGRKRGIRVKSKKCKFCKTNFSKNHVQKCNVCGHAIHCQRYSDQHNSSFY